MASFNQVTLLGHVTRDPQLKYLPNQTAVTEFGLAMNRKYRNGGGEDKEEVCFVDCTIFGKAAEVVNQYVTKGKPLLVSGRLRYEAWEAKDGGGKRSKLTVTVENFQFIGGRDGDGAGDGGNDAERALNTPPRREGGKHADMFRKPAAAGASQRPQPPFDPGAQEFQDSDIPFAWSGRMSQPL